MAIVFVIDQSLLIGYQDDENGTINKRKHLDEYVKQRSYITENKAGGLTRIHLMDVHLYFTQFRCIE